MNLKKTVLTAAIATALGTASMGASATAVTMTMDWAGLFTMLNPAGSPLVNTDAKNTAPYFGNRTPVSGTMTFCAYTGTGTNTSCGALSAGQGTGSVASFSFFGGGVAIATTITMQAIGGTLILANMGFNWAGNNGIPVSLVLDAAGFFGAMGTQCGGLGCGTSSTVSGVGVLAASDNTNFGTNASPVFYSMGVLPIASTTWNTTQIAIGLGTNPSGTLPLIADTASDSGSCTLSGTSCGATLDVGIGGNPMNAGPFTNFNANFDIQNLHITSVTVHPDVSAVPVPAAAWLFGSGLLGLVGVARRKRTA